MATRCFRGAPFVVATLLCALVLLTSGRARAHAVGLSRGTYAAQGDGVDVDITFARGEVASLLPTLDLGHVERSGADLERVVLGKIDIHADGARCARALTGVALTDQDGIAIRGHYTCPRGDAPVHMHIDLAILDDLAHGHRHLVHASAGSVTLDDVCFRAHPSFDFVAASAEQPSGRASPSAVGFVRMGIEHILTGYDHLVFLFGLILVGGRVRSIALVITAFTVAHSITLALAALGVWAPPPSIVEPAIALSIAYVGAENFFVASAEKRWRITFPFGLIHGFGFAGALRGIGLPHEEIPKALVFFNVGVELGQLGVLALVLPIVYALRKADWFRRARMIDAMSAAVIVLGVVWFIDRIRPSLPMLALT
jgi:hydrogenase/urease accessory protein HupE